MGHSIDNSSSAKYNSPMQAANHLPAQPRDDEKLRDFFHVLRSALLMIVKWIEKNYP